jgi:ComF family protein
MIDVLSEPWCARCGVPISGAVTQATVCGRCRKSAPSFGKARAVARYRSSDSDGADPLSSILRRHKYGLDQSLIRALTECLGERVLLDANDYDVIIPVPLHWRRLYWRGFNQAALLARALAHKMALPVDASSLLRTRATVPQTAQSSGERRRNIKGAFAVRRPDRVAGKRVLLVDDVITTGATVDECARVLKASGARAVDVFALARRA